MKHEIIDKDECKIREFLTVGYEGSDLNAFIQALQKAQIQTLVDVRELPLSRKKGFSKTPLREALEGAGIAYVHLKNLGDPKEGREAAKAGNYSRFVEVFAGHMQTSAAVEALDDLKQIVQEQRACLMCFERDHRHCHRTIVADQLISDSVLTVRHMSV